MVDTAFHTPEAPLWLYVFVVIILLVLAWIGAGMLTAYTGLGGNMQARGGWVSVILAIILGIVIYFLIAAGIEDWAYFVAFLPTAILLFGIYFAFFAAFGAVSFWIGTIIALFVMIWLTIYAFTEQQWAFLAFPIVYLIMVIAGGAGWGMWAGYKNKKGGDMKEMRSMMSDMDMSMSAL
jgi:hypothetical protein